MGELLSRADTSAVAVTNIQSTVVPIDLATKKSADELVTYYRDHDTEQTIGALLIGVAAITLLFWAGQLRRVLRDAEGQQRVVSYRVRLDSIRIEEANRAEETADYFIVEE